ncbi:MAG: tetratricopeptide repeat protein [Bryobacteraceae bacterium]|nr:tetratricopeptide repeat protein [Bryobacteraceae bacterium]
MSTYASDLPLSIENRVELRKLRNMLRLANGFVLGFAAAAHPSLKQRLIAEIRAALPEKEIVELAVDPAAEAGIVTQWKLALGERRPDALFVHGLETLFDLTTGDSPAIGMFNFNRDYVTRRFPFPVVFWAPEFAIREFARAAPDFWSGRSQLYRFTGEEGDAKETLEAVDAELDWNLSRKDKLERRELLRELLEELEGAPGAGAASLAKVKYLLAQAAGYESEWDEARELYQQALPLYRAIGDRQGEANGIKSLGDVAGMQDRYEEARELYQQALPLYRAIGDRLGEANAIKSLGDVARMQARYEEAGELYQQALPLYRAIGERLGEANAIQSLGDVARMQARYEEAGELYQQALLLYRAIGDRQGEANAIKSLGDVARMQDRYEEAGELYQQALPLYRAIGDRLGEANAIQSLGDVARMQDRYEEARELYQQALPLYRAIGARLGEANAIQSLGDVAMRQDRYEEARELYQQALPLSRAIGDRLGEANAIQSLGDVAMSQDRYEEARELYQQALPLSRAIGDRLGEANTLLSQGRLGKTRTRRRARRVLGSGKTLRSHRPEPLSGASRRRSPGDVTYVQTRYHLLHSFRCPRRRTGARSAARSPGQPALFYGRQRAGRLPGRLAHLEQHRRYGAQRSAAEIRLRQVSRVAGRLRP